VLITIASSDGKVNSRWHAVSSIIQERAK
jgi:hypothetical protein